MSQPSFLVIEMADCELLSVRMFTNEAAAFGVFDSCVDENEATPFEWNADDVAGEVAGTLRVAGDDTYSVQVIKLEPER
jgi:hypothetical protein